MDCLLPKYTVSPPSISRAMDIALTDCKQPHVSDFHQLGVGQRVTKVPPATTPTTVPTRRP